MFFVVATQNLKKKKAHFRCPRPVGPVLDACDPGYPSAEDEQRILRERPNDRTLLTLAEVMSPQDMLTLRQQADGIHLAEDAERWIVAFAQATRLPSVAIGAFTSRFPCHRHCGTDASVVG